MWPGTPAHVRPRQGAAVGKARYLQTVDHDYPWTASIETCGWHCQFAFSSVTLTSSTLYLGAKTFSSISLQCALRPIASLRSAKHPVDIFSMLAMNKVFAVMLIAGCCMQGACYYQCVIHAVSSAAGTGRLSNPFPCGRCLARPRVSHCCLCFQRVADIPLRWLQAQQHIPQAGHAH